MRTRTVIERIGELLGPVDWSYDFRSHFNTLCTNDAGRDEACEKAKERLRLISESPGKYRVSTYGGWPRIWQDIVSVGMYDGWPYWKPTPFVCSHSTLGCEWHSFSMITNILNRETGEII
jgi:hypothetical protein